MFFGESLLGVKDNGPLSVPSEGEQFLQLTVRQRRLRREESNLKSQIGDAEEGTRHSNDISPPNATRLRVPEEVTPICGMSCSSRQPSLPGTSRW